MITFLIGIAILILGYFTWGKIAEKIFGPDNRLTPAYAGSDGVERVPLSSKRNMMLQLLNIAGMGPIVGVALGAKFGPIIFLLIPIGNVIGGAIHDYFAGMISMRNNGSDLPSLIRKFFGRFAGGIFVAFVSIALLLVVTTFTNIPANFIVSLLPFGTAVLVISILIIFAYYILSSLFPIDKIIGRIYPFFGGTLILITVLVCIALIPQAGLIPNLPLSAEGIAAAFDAHPDGQPILPMLFITIACGIMSGFHATQSPIVAKTIRREKEGRRIFYGMMIVEGVIAMIWAAACSLLFTLSPETLGLSNGNTIITTAVFTLLPYILGVLAIIVFIFLAVTSGDTALRVLRTTAAEFLHIDQKKAQKRVLTLLPFIVIIAGLLLWSNLSPTGYAVLWNYFAWFNQIIASCALLMATAYLACKAKPWIITGVPAAFMCFICLTYLFWSSPEHLAGVPFGIGLPLEVSYVISAVLAVALLAGAVIRGRRLSKKEDFSPECPAKYPEE